MKKSTTWIAFFSSTVVGVLAQHYSYAFSMSYCSIIAALCGMEILKQMDEK